MKIQRIIRSTRLPTQFGSRPVLTGPKIAVLTGPSQIKLEEPGLGSYVGPVQKAVQSGPVCGPMDQTSKLQLPNKCNLTFGASRWWFSIECTGYLKWENHGKILKMGRIQGILLRGVATSLFNNYLSSDSLFIYYYLLGPRREEKIAPCMCPRTNLRPLPYIWGCGH